MSWFHFGVLRMFALFDVGHARDDLRRADVEADTHSRAEELRKGVETDDVVAVLVADRA